MNENNLNFSEIYKYINSNTPFARVGKISSSHGLVYEVNLSRAILGSNVEFQTPSGEKCGGEIVGIRGNKCLAMPYDQLQGINTETRVVLKEMSTTIKISNNMVGRIIDFQGNPIDGKGPIEGPFEKRSIYSVPINPLARPPIKEPLDTGIKAINGFITVGKGQRIAIMAGSGVGKSVLMGMVARNTKADVNVIALVGERGREVLEFIQNDLGDEGLKKSIVLVATSDTSPLMRTKAAFAATAIAEFFRDKQNDVMLLMDSITRLAMAQREIGLSAGEPPGQKGYTPSVFSQLPQILERAGTKEGAGSITGFYTVLVEGGDMDEPITDAIRAISDGHIILSRELASKNHYPAIDVLNSISRVMNKVVTNEHRIISSHLRNLLAAYANSEDLINVGAYVEGTNLEVDKAISIHYEMRNLLRQDIEDSLDIDTVYDELVRIAKSAEEAVNPELLEPSDEDEQSLNII